MKGWTAAALLVLSPAFHDAAAEGWPALDRCEELVAAQPQAKEAAKCFWDAAAQPGLRAPAAGRLAALLPRYPDSPWLHFYTGNFLWSEHARAAEAYGRAAELLAVQGDRIGESTARTNRYTMLQVQGRIDEAGAELARVRAAAEASEDALAMARAKALQAGHLDQTGGDLARALLLLREAEPTLRAAAEYYPWRDWLKTYANLSLTLGRRSAAAQAYAELAELTSRPEANDGATYTIALYGLARVAVVDAMELPGEATRREARARLEAALAAAAAANDRSVRHPSEHALALLSPGSEGVLHAERCRAAAENDRDRSYCESILGRRLSESDPSAAQAALDRACVYARRAGESRSLIQCWIERMRLSWEELPPREAVAGGLVALDVIEALREMQPSQGERAELFSNWIDDYRWLAGRLFTAHRRSGDRELLEHAFGVNERMRARSLLETVVARAGSSAPLSPAVAALQLRRSAALEELAQVQRRLLDPGLPPPAHAAARRDLERLEVAEADLRHRLATAAPALAWARRPALVSLHEAQRALAADEALLSFQVAPRHDPAGRPAGGAWSVLVTRNRAQAFELTERGELRSLIRFFEGQIRSRDGGEVQGAVVLHRRLLGPALAALPPGIERLILIPDDDLHRLPFAALRERPGGPPLGALYELSVAPSATLWRRWRQPETPPAALRPALALADPPSPGAGTTSWRGAPAERAAVFGAAVKLPPLPYARREGRAVVRSLGRHSELRLGDDASEAYVKRTSGRFGLYHFAAHALIDDEMPERSGVVLAPGAGGEDGLLQVREIADLDLDGAVVVLASCRSGSGQLLRGEGVMGLARAFFQAGARAVVVSLWRLRDDDAEALFANFYRHLGEGKTLAAALRAAQAERIAAGAPAAAWAGLVVLGDGELAPAAARPWWDVPAGTLAGGAIAALAAALAAAGFLAMRRRRRLAATRLPAG